ncbi:helix-turn-helix domain-containing protein [Sphingobacterium lactis]|uniref:helix-turn-helix domain-containing protein n=1 Tax=Sphingobacterium lactis TaxID=797291 RepID=UPI003DA69CDE
MKSIIRLIQKQFNPMELKPIKTIEDYNQALKRLEIIFDAEQNTAEGNELEILGILIEKYEETNCPIELPDPIEAIKFRMDQLNYSQKELGEIIGKNRASEILNRKRKLSISMIRKIAEKLHISSDVLIQQYE